MPDKNFRKLICENILQEDRKHRNFYIGKNDVEKIENASYLDFTGIYLENLFLNVTSGVPEKNLNINIHGIENFKNLKKLDVSLFALEKTNFKLLQQLQRLEFLNVTETGIKALDASHWYHLKKLFCASNQLEYINIKKNPNLEILVCNDNSLKHLDVGSNKNLRQLVCYKNHIKMIDVSKNHRLIDFKFDSKVQVRKFKPIQKHMIAKNLNRVKNSGKHFTLGGK